MMPVSLYAPEWVERGAILDFICGQLDRGGHNWLTHPDDPMRPIFIDNGLTFPVDDNHVINSAFLRAWEGKAISADNLEALQFLAGKRSVWRDIQDCVGGSATQLSQGRVAKMLANGVIEV